MKSIVLNNVSYKNDKVTILNNLSLEVREGHPISIIGDSGKTTIIRIIEHKLTCEGDLKINGIPVNDDNFRLLSKYYKVIDKDLKFKRKKVKEEILHSLSKNTDEVKDKKEMLEILLNKFDLFPIMNLEVERLGRIESYLLRVVCALIEKPAFLILDNILEEFDKKTRSKIFKYCKKNKITIVNITSNLETSLDTEYLYCLYKGKVILEGTIPDIFKEEKIFKRLGYNLPFIVDMSIQLGYYELTDKIYLDKDGLVRDVWK